MEEYDLRNFVHTVDKIKCDGKRERREQRIDHHCTRLVTRLLGDGRIASTKSFFPAGSHHNNTVS